MYHIFTNPKDEALHGLVNILFESKHELLVEDSTVIKHLEHLEDLTLTSKDRFVRTIKGLLKIAHQHEGADDTLVIEKIDGAPSLFILDDPRTNTLAVSTKSIGAKTQKVYHTSQEIANKVESAGLALKLEKALIFLKGLDFKGHAFQGDVLFTREDMKKQRIKGKDYLTFTPNVLMYAVAIDAASELYQKISSSEFGLVVHTVYDVEILNGALDLKRITNYNAILDLVEQANTIDGLFMTHPYHKQIKLEVSETDIAKVEQVLADLENTEYKVPSVKTKGYFDQFINNAIRLDNISQDPQEMMVSLMNFLEKKKNDELEKRKSDKGKESVTATFNEIFEEVQSESFQKFIKVYTEAMGIKAIFLDIFGRVGSKIGATFFQKGSDFETTGPEGFILSADEGIVKLVDRNVFSRTNFLFGAFQKPPA